MRSLVSQDIHKIPSMILILAVIPNSQEITHNFLHPQEFRVIFHLLLLGQVQMYNPHLLTITTQVMFQVFRHIQDLMIILYIPVHTLVKTLIHHIIQVLTLLVTLMHLHIQVLTLVKTQFHLLIQVVLMFNQVMIL